MSKRTKFTVALFTYLNCIAYFFAVVIFATAGGTRNLALLLSGLAAVLLAQLLILYVLRLVKGVGNE